MYQPSLNNNSGVRYSSGQADPTLSYRIDIICLAILFVGFFSCLIRSDYNFAIIFFVYFIWQQRKDSLALKIVLAATVFLIIFDLIFAFTQVRVWVTDDSGNQVWQTLKSLHMFGIVCMTLIMILKIILVILAAMGISKLGKAVQSN